MKTKLFFPHVPLIPPVPLRHHPNVLWRWVLSDSDHSQEQGFFLRGDDRSIYQKLDFTSQISGQELIFSWWDTEWLMPLAARGLFSSICPSVATGYIEAAVIPAGARRIRVVEDKPAHSFLGKKTEQKIFSFKTQLCSLLKWSFSKCLVSDGFVVFTKWLWFCYCFDLSTFVAWFHDTCLTW